MVQDVNENSVASAELIVNGEKVNLNNFVQGFITQTLIGMVKSLQGVDKIMTIELRVTKN